ncbi:MAG: hypothetical protein QNJ51_09300 [Calothrix sp. MO_167.B12]|nr:hypothetical protein [Calothrix sp. MO_167.B12]
MKSFVRWGTTLGLATATLLAPVSIISTPVLALSEAEVIKKLNDTPCFLITNNKGLPLTRRLPGKDGKQGAPFTQVFMNGREAQAFIDQLRKQKTQDPKMAAMIKELRVTAVGLGDIYKKFRENAKDPNSLKFAFQPGQEEVRGAIALLKQQGRKIDKFVSVPLFMISAEGKGYVSVKRKSDNKEIIPLYFSKKDAQGLLQRVKKQYPKAKVEVGDIDGVIAVLRKKNDKWLNNVVLVAPSDSLQYINQLQRSSSAQSPKPKR